MYNLEVVEFLLSSFSETYGALNNLDEAVKVYLVNANNLIKFKQLSKADVDLVYKILGLNVKTKEISLDWENRVSDYLYWGHLCVRMARNKQDILDTLEESVARGMLSCEIQALLLESFEIEVKKSDEKQKSVKESNSGANKNSIKAKMSKNLRDFMEDKNKMRVSTADSCHRSISYCDFMSFVRRPDALAILDDKSSHDFVVREKNNDPCFGGYIDVYKGTLTDFDESVLRNLITDVIVIDSVSHYYDFNSFCIVCKSLSSMSYNALTVSDREAIYTSNDKISMFLRIIQKNLLK